MAKQEMNREQKREITKSKIVKCSARLFGKQGYEETSIRQIVKESEISSGSIYHFFKNKEGILLSIFERIHNQLKILNQEIIRKFKEPLLQFSLSAAVQLSVILEDKEILNLYRVIWTIQAIEEIVLRHRTKRTREIMENSIPDFTYTDDEIYARELAVNRAAGALCEAKSNGHVAMKVEDIWILIIRIWLSEFGISQARADAIVELTKELMWIRGKGLKERFLNAFINNFK